MLRLGTYIYAQAVVRRHRWCCAWWTRTASDGINNSEVCGNVDWAFGVRVGCGSSAVTFFVDVSEVPIWWWLCLFVGGWCVFRSLCLGFIVSGRRGWWLCQVHAGPAGE